MEKGFCLERSEEETEGSDGTCEDTADTTMFVQIEEVQGVRVGGFVFVIWLQRVRQLWKETRTTGSILE